MTPFLLLGLGMAIVLLLVIWLKVHPFLALIIAATVVSFATPEKSLESYANNYTQSQQDRGKMDESQALQFKKDFAKLSSMKRVVQEFGGGCAKVGLIIAFAALIGKCMLESGAASRVVMVALSVFGEKRAGLAFCAPVSFWLCQSFLTQFFIFLYRLLWPWRIELEVIICFMYYALWPVGPWHILWFLRLRDRS